MFGLFNKTKHYQDLDASTFAEGMKKNNSVVLDVRTKSEFNSGHLPGAKHLDVSSREFYQKAQQLDRTKHYMVYCRSGMRSGDACKQLSKMEFEQLSNLRGGIMQWRGKIKR